MDAQVTEEMVTAAQRELPGVWNRERVRRALAAALAAMPGPQPQIPVSARVSVRLDTNDLANQVGEAVTAWWREQPKNPEGLLVADFVVALPAGAQPRADVRVPHLNPALDHPLELGSLADIARRLEVARSTVTGWVKNRANTGMPAPVDGDVYDLPAIEAWYREWKGLDGAAAR